MISSRTVGRGLAPVMAGLSLVLAGCGEAPHAGGGGHSHGSAHGGVAVELGEHQFHLDILATPSSGTLQVWVMDAHVTDFVRVPLASIEVQVEVPGVATNGLSLAAQANTATGETVGNTSHFSGQASWLQGVERFTGVVPAIEIRGQQFRDVRFSYP